MTPVPFLEPIDAGFNLATEADLKLIEETLGAPVPTQVSTFLQNFGRSMFFDGDAVVTAQDGEECGVFTFFCAAGPTGSVIADLLSHPDYVADGLLPIADDLSNNRFVVRVDTNEVWFIEYARGVVSTHLVANSFGEFLEAIEVMPD